jgi:hypothetical protein
MACPFCGREARFENNRHMIDGALWRCGCGVMGLSCIPPDLDDASDQFFDVLGIHGVSFREPAVPVGRSGHLSLQHYDSPQLLGQLTAFFEGRGYQVRFEEVGFLYRFPDGREQEHEQWFFWIKPGAEG